MTRPLTILHTRVVTGAGGGPDKTILRSAAALDTRRFRMAAAYLHPAGDPGIETLRGTASRFGMPMHTIPERGPIDPRALRFMLDLCRRLHVEVWHSHDYKTDVIGRLLRRKHPMKLVSTMHGFTRETWRTRSYAKLNDLALIGYDRVLAVSPLLLRHAAEHGVHPDKLDYVPNAIDLSEYCRQQTKDQARQSLDIVPGEHAMAVVARFSPEKGVDRTLRFFAVSRKQHPNARLHLIGDGPQRRALEQLANELGIGQAVRWWGWQRDTRPILEAMDCLLLTSHTEGMPNAMLEAMALGVPIAATRVGAVPEMLDQGRCGVMLDEDESAWIQQVSPMVNQPLFRERLIDAASKRVASQYDFTKRMQKVTSIYEQVCGRGRKAATVNQAA